MTKPALFIDEATSTTLYAWVNLNDYSVILIDSGDRGDGLSHIHHTDYVKQKPALFGLDVQDVMWAKDVRDDELLEKVLANGFVRAIMEPNEGIVNLEALTMKANYKALRILIKAYEIQPTTVIVDVGNIASNSADYQSHRLTGQKLEIFLKTGSISQSRYMIESANKSPADIISKILNKIIETDDERQTDLYTDLFLSAVKKVCPTVIDTKIFKGIKNNDQTLVSQICVTYSFNDKNNTMKIKRTMVIVFNRFGPVVGVSLADGSRNVTAPSFFFGENISLIGGTILKFLKMGEKFDRQEVTEGRLDGQPLSKLLRKFPNRLLNLENYSELLEHILKQYFIKNGCRPLVNVTYHSQRYISVNFEYSVPDQTKQGFIDIKMDYGELLVDLELNWSRSLIKKNLGPIETANIDQWFQTLFASEMQKEFTK